MSGFYHVGDPSSYELLGGASGFGAGACFRQPEGQQGSAEKARSCSVCGGCVRRDVVWPSFGIGSIRRVISLR